MKSSDKSIKNILAKLVELLQSVKPYGFVLFVVFVAGLYGFVVLRISSLNNTEPTSDAVSSQVQAAKIPKVDERIVKQLQSLRDNSDSVRTLFDQARDNPFDN